MSEIMPERPDEEEMPAALQTLVRHMESNGLLHKVEADKLAVSFYIRGRSGGRFRCVGFLNETQDLFQFIVVFPDHVPPNRRKAMARAITLANFGMKLGFFEMDFDDGELRVHTASAFEPGHLPDSVVNWCVSSAIAIADRYYPALQSVSWGGRDPADAIFEAEHPEASLLYGSVEQEEDDEEGGRGPGLDGPDVSRERENPGQDEASEDDSPEGPRS
jgi:hypothetical protein